MKVSQMKIKVLPDEGVLVLGGPNLYNIAKIFESVSYTHLTLPTIA